MEPVNVILIVALVALIPLAGFISYTLGKKGIDTGKAINAAGTVAQVANSAFDTIRPLLPNSPAVSILDTIFNCAEWGVGQAEQLYKITQINKDERKAKATEFIYQALGVAKIEITPEIESLISGAVDGAVAFIPKTHDENGNVIK